MSNYKMHFINTAKDKEKRFSLVCSARNEADAITMLKAVFPKATVLDICKISGNAAKNSKNEKQGTIRVPAKGEYYFL